MYSLTPFLRALVPTKPKITEESQAKKPSGPQVPHLSNMLTAPALGDTEAEGWKAWRTASTNREQVHTPHVLSPGAPVDTRPCCHRKPTTFQGDCLIYIFILCYLQCSWESTRAVNYLGEKARLSFKFEVKILKDLAPHINSVNALASYGRIWFVLKSFLYGRPGAWGGDVQRWGSVKGDYVTGALPSEAIKACLVGMGWVLWHCPGYSTSGLLWSTAAFPACSLASSLTMWFSYVLLPGDTIHHMCHRLLPEAVTWSWNSQLPELWAK